MNYTALASSLKRLEDLTHKVWLYCLGALERPRELPFLIWLIAARGVHLGELLSVGRHRSWLQSAGIKTVIDVGAHTGQFASAIRSILPDAAIYSFEPQLDCYQKLKHRMSRFPRFHAFCVGLGNHRGEIRFWRSNFTKSSSFLPMSSLHKKAFPWSRNNNAIFTNMKRLDDYTNTIQLSSKVLLKIDVQGYEVEVLRGGRRFLKHVDYVLVEVSYAHLYRHQATFEDVYSLLRQSGFRYLGNWGQLSSPLDGAILQADALFARTTIRRKYIARFP